MSDDEASNPWKSERIRSLPAIPSGSLRLDIALGVGGIAPGQFVEISGAESSGKTTLCQHIVAGAQKMGRLCAWIDMDHSFNPGYAVRCGVDPHRLYIASPKDAEQAFDILETLCGTEAGSVIVLDSVEALTSRSELDLALGDPAQLEDGQDRSEKLLSLTVRRLAPVIQKDGAVVLFVTRSNRQRSEAYHQLSGHLARLALKLHASLRLRLHATGFLLREKIIIGQKVQAKILKSHNINPLLPVEFDIIYDEGINPYGEVFDLGLQLGLIRQQDQVYVFQGLSLGTGRQQAIESLERQALTGSIERVIRQKLLGTAFVVGT